MTVEVVDDVIVFAAVIYTDNVIDMVLVDNIVGPFIADNVIVLIRIDIQHVIVISFLQHILIQELGNRALIAHRLDGFRVFLHPGFLPDVFILCFLLLVVVDLSKHDLFSIPDRLRFTGPGLRRSILDFPIIRAIRRNKAHDDYRYFDNP